MISDAIAALYGHAPREAPEIRTDVLEETVRKDGSVRRQLRITLRRGAKETSFTLLMLIPNGTGPFPVMLAANLNGNHSASNDPAIIPSAAPDDWGWRLGMPRLSVSAGAFQNRFPAEFLVSQGIIAATFFYEEAEPDRAHGLRGVRSLYGADEADWGTLRAWAWAYERAIDVLQQDPHADTARVMAYGFSRAGKAVLLAGAADERIAAIVAEGSGKGGAALWAHLSGEPRLALYARYGHWFTQNGRQMLMGQRPFACDQDELLAALAPRPALIVVGADDWWSDPEGQRAAVRKAKGVYGADESMLRFVVRAGGHEPQESVWAGHLRSLRQSGAIIAA